MYVIIDAIDKTMQTAVRWAKAYVAYVAAI